MAGSVASDDNGHQNGNSGEVSDPVASNKRSYKRHYVGYVLNNGKIQYFSSAKASKQFKKDYIETIEDTIVFNSRSEMEEHSKSKPELVSLAVTEPSKNDPSVALNLSTKDKEKLDKALAKIDDDRPSNRLHFFYKSTSNSRKAVFVLRFEMETGRDTWLIKGDFFAIAMRNYVEQFPCLNPTFQKALLSISYGKMRDLAKSRDSAVVNLWKSPLPGGREIEFPSHVAFGDIDLPIKDLKSTAEEDELIENTLRAIGAFIIKTIQTDVFAACFQRAIGRENMWNAITSADNPGKSYMHYIKGCKVKISKEEDSLNKHLVKVDANKAASRLFDSRLPSPKYPAEISSFDDDSDDEDGEDAGTRVDVSRDNEKTSSGKETGGSKGKSVTRNEEIMNHSSFNSSDGKASGRSQATNMERKRKEESETEQEEANNEVARGESTKDRGRTLAVGAKRALTANNEDNRFSNEKDKETDVVEPKTKKRSLSAKRLARKRKEDMSSVDSNTGNDPIEPSRHVQCTV